MVSPPLRTAVVTDSSCALPRDVIAPLPLKVAPFQVVIEGKAYLDDVDISREEFYDLLPRLKRLPTTAAPSPGSFLEAFREARRLAPSILCITLSSRLSAAYSSAQMAVDMARQEMPEVPIRLLDSRTAAAGLALVALAAAHCARQGADIEEVARRAEEVARRVYLLGTLDTLYYVWKGGRIPKVALWAAALLDLKPIMEIREGEVRLLERPRSRARALDRLVALVRERTTGHPLRVNLMHANAPQEARALEENLRGAFPVTELLVTLVTPVIGAHAGPGLLGIAFYEESPCTPSL